MRVHHRLSSVAFPHSNCRAEIGVKTARRMIAENTGPNGNLDTDAFQRAMLQYRNCPDPDTKLSPAMCLFGRPIKDIIPILPGKYLPHETWQDMLSKREEALRNRHMRGAEGLSEHTVAMPSLVVSDRSEFRIKGDQIRNDGTKLEQSLRYASLISTLSVWMDQEESPS